MKLFIVDDDSRIRKMIASIAAGPADEVIEFDDGREARAGYERHYPDWVLMDLMMPGTNGIDATREIISSFPAAKIIIVTSYESEAMRQSAASAGAYGYVLKDNLSELRGMIAE